MIIFLGVLGAGLLTYVLYRGLKAIIDSKESK
jgi:hypothetical protein